MLMMLSVFTMGKSTLESLDRYFQMKKGSMGDPDLYIGAKHHKVTLHNGVQVWSTSPSKYIQEAVKNAEKYPHINCGGMKLAKRANAPFPVIMLQKWTQVQSLTQRGPTITSHSWECCNGWLRLAELI